MSILELLLTPLTALMRVVLELLYSGVGSYGVAIILLSVVVRVLTTPIVRSAAGFEERERLTQVKMAPALAEAKANFRGRERFEKIEAIYEAHNYHPIKSLASLLPLLLQIPFLLSALFLLLDYPPLQGTPFLFITDLAQPDRIISTAAFSVNVIPILLTAVAVLEALLNPVATVQSVTKFLIVAIVLLVLIYPLPAAVCLYWLTSNAWSFCSSMLGRRKRLEG